MIIKAIQVNVLFHSSANLLYINFRVPTCILSPPKIFGKLHNGRCCQHYKVSCEARVHKNGRLEKERVTLVEVHSPVRVILKIEHWSHA